MSFLTQDDNTYINIKLTDTGRRRLAQGNLTFDQAVLSDRETNYSFDRRYDTLWNLNPNSGTELALSGNSIFSPKDDHPALSPINYDGSQPYSLNSRVHVKNETTTAQTDSVGFWSALTNGNKHKIGRYLLKNNWVYSGSNSTSIQEGAIDFVFGTSNLLAGVLPKLGQLLYLRTTTSINTANGFLGMSNARYNDVAMISKWYRVTNEISSGRRTLDRNPPFIAAQSGQDKPLPYFVYEFDAVDNYYGSAVTVNCPVWNLNIVRTSREIGHKRKAVGGNIGHSYTNYGSVPYAGAKEMFDFDENQRQVGFLHYSNESSGQTYWDSIIPGATEVDIPDLLWHRATDESGNLFISGTAISSGHRFTDYGSTIYQDKKAGTSYTLLRDAVTGSPLTVGRVYYDLKTIVLTDPELLTALSYKSNRNWTLPPMNFSSVSSPKPQFDTGKKPGFMKSNHNYYMTYYMSPGELGELSSNAYLEGRNFGHHYYMHCGYVQKLSGHTDENGYHKHLKGTFPQGQLPYMRNSQTFESFSGTGWGASKVQILVQEVPVNRDGGADSLHPGKWSGCSSLNKNAQNQDPAGVFSFGHASSSLIEPSQLYNAEFIVSQADITSGDTMPLLLSGSTRNIYELHDYFNLYNDEKNNGLALGSENHFFGNIKTAKKKVRYDTYITLVVEGGELNSSQNSSFDAEKNDNTYITEIGVLNSDGELVAVGKPTRPIRKGSGEWKVLQLKLEF